MTTYDNEVNYDDVTLSMIIFSKLMTTMASENKKLCLNANCRGAIMSFLQSQLEFMRERWNSYKRAPRIVDLNIMSINSKELTDRSVQVYEYEFANIEITDSIVGFFVPAARFLLKTPQIKLQIVFSALLETMSLPRLVDPLCPEGPLARFESKNIAICGENNCDEDRGE